MNFKFDLNFLYYFNRNNKIIYINTLFIQNTKMLILALPRFLH